MTGEVCIADNSFASDALRNLQIRLQMSFGSGRAGGASVIVVTSPLPGEGKSFISWNLASSFAKSGQRVLLIDTDFRKGTLSASQHCLGKLGLTDALVTGSWNREWIVNTEISGCSFLSAGTQREQGLRQFSRAAIEHVLNLIKPGFDIIIIDTAPVLALADVCLMPNLSDVILMVIRSRQSKLVHVQRASAMLQAAISKPFHIVINGVAASDARCDDYYFSANSYGDVLVNEPVSS